MLKKRRKNNFTLGNTRRLVSKQKIKDIVFFPIRFIFDHKTVNACGLTSLRDERINVCLKYCRGKVLDIGCGEGNKLVRRYKNGIGVDVYMWRGIDVLCDTANLPFKDKAFDTVTLIASIGHIPDRAKVLRECYRVLKDEGQILATTLDPIFGWLRHKLAWWDRDQIVRGIKKGEVWGLWGIKIKKLFILAGFSFERKIPFTYLINSLYIGKKSKKDKIVNK